MKNALIGIVAAVTIVGSYTFFVSWLRKKIEESQAEYEKNQTMDNGECYYNSLDDDND